MKFITFKLCALTSVFSIGFLAQGQNLAANDSYDRFDKAFGKKNLGINNGTVHVNPYKSDNVTHRYLLDKYTTGDVFYDGQFYPKYDLKYDLYQDGLIAKVDGKNNNMGINLIAQKTAYFTIDGKKFVNLDLTTAKPPFASGYYEEDIFSDNVRLYIKHRKKLLEIINTEGKRYKFVDSEKFLLRYNGNWHEIDSQNSVAEIFPDKQKQIADFFETSKKLRNSDPKQFMRNLIKSLQN